MAEEWDGCVSEGFEWLVASTKGPQHLRRLVHACVSAARAWRRSCGRSSRPQAVSAAAGAGVALGLLGLDLARLAAPRLNLRFYRLFRSLFWPREAGGVASSTWYMVGILVVVILFPLEAVVPAIWVLALADPAASYIGRRRGRRPLGAGTWEGLAAFVLVAGAILSAAVKLPVVLLTALLAGLVGIVPWRVDENLAIPLVVSGVLWLGG